MTHEETAAACADAVSGIAATFMLDPATYAAGAEAGFSGIDFYTGGRGGALGDVDADVVAAAFAFFEPSTVRANWELAGKAMAPRDAAGAFIACGHRWAAEHLAADGCDWARLAELQGRVNAAASPACAPLFAAWRAMPEPADDDPRVLALHRLNVARELRFAMHAAAVVAACVSAPEAMAVRSPYMGALFGWPELPEVTDELKARWEGAEAATNRALAPAYAAVGEGERTELASLCAAALGAVS
jgi:hypothetical protein